MVFRCIICRGNQNTFNTSIYTRKMLDVIRDYVGDSWSISITKCIKLNEILHSQGARLVHAKAIHSCNIRNVFDSSNLVSGQFIQFAIDHLQFAAYVLDGRTMDDKVSCGRIEGSLAYVPLKLSYKHWVIKWFLTQSELRCSFIWIFYLSDLQWTDQII